MSWPANQFAGNIRRQDPGRAAFLNRLFANRRPPRLEAIFKSRANREYGSTYPFQRFLAATRANQLEDVTATSYQVRPTASTQRPSSIRGGTP